MNCKKRKNTPGRRITDEYYADGEFHYKYKNYNKCE